MFPEFHKHYEATDRNAAADPIEGNLDGLFREASGAVEFLKEFGGTTFGHGIYRLHATHTLQKWNAIIWDAFPKFARRTCCFGCDWLGRQFALDGQRRENGEPMVLLLEPGTGIALEIPATFGKFHEGELVGYAEAALALNAFNKWRSTHPTDLRLDQCVGYIVPLFLGGKDTQDNFEMTDMEVYWSICGQMLAKTRNLPAGTKIGKIDIKG